MVAVIGGETHRFRPLIDLYYEAAENAEEEYDSDEERFKIEIGQLELNENPEELKGEEKLRCLQAARAGCRKPCVAHSGLSLANCAPPLCCPGGPPHPPLGFVFSEGA